MKPERILSILVRNRPGVLTKIAGVFYRRGHNIKSLTVGKTQSSEVSKLTISLPMEDSQAKILCRQIETLVDVHSALLLDPKDTIDLEVCLLRLACHNAEERVAIMASASPYRPRLRKVEEESIVLQIAEQQSLVDDFVAVMDEHHILDVSRTGMTALGPNQTADQAAACDCSNEKYFGAGQTWPAQRRSHP